MSTRHIDRLSTLPLSMLRIFFDVAARHQTMVKAAAALGITQGAVSRQLKLLEERLGIALFVRGPRGVTLTEAGDLLADHVGRAFGELSTGLHRLGQPRSRTTLVVAASRTFALRVIAPRLGGFVHRHPWIDLRLDTHRTFTDLSRSTADISIRNGDGKWRGHAVQRLTHDTLFPVCAPALWPNRGRGEASPDLLRRHVLLHFAERPYWSSWLACAGFEASIDKGGPSFSETALAFAAAEAGQGIAIARSSLVRDALEAGRLVRPFDASFEEGIDYFLVTRPADARKPMVKAFSEWILSELSPDG